MSKRPKESGFAFRQKRKKREIEQAELSGSMSKFLNINPKPCSSSTRTESESSADDDDGEKTEIEFEEQSETQTGLIDTESEQQDASQKHDDNESESEERISSKENDPSTWPPVLSHSFREKIVRSGIPSTPEHHLNYPQNKGRSFLHSYFYATQANGDTEKREWLIYSESNDSVYCLFCLLFNRGSNAFLLVLVTLIGRM